MEMNSMLVSSKVIAIVSLSVKKRGMPKTFRKE
jgi:hypothetical protein